MYSAVYLTELQNKTVKEGLKTVKYSLTHLHNILILNAIEILVAVIVRLR